MRKNKNLKEKEEKKMKNKKDMVEGTKIGEGMNPALPELEGRLHGRLEDLKNQFASGNKDLNVLGKRTGELEQTLLRISGAIQVLEEELKIKVGE